MRGFVEYASKQALEVEGRQPGACRGIRQRDALIEMSGEIISRASEAGLHRRRHLWGGPLALDGQAKPLEHRFDILFTEARSGVLHVPAVERWKELHSLDSVPTVHVGNGGGIVLRQRADKIVINVNLGHFSLGP